VAQAVRTGLAWRRDNLVSRFDRKNYFYPDLPAANQITSIPPHRGRRVIESNWRRSTRDRVTAAHGRTREKPARQHPTKSYIDLNRSGVGLMEIVSEPDLRSPEEAGAYIRKLRSIMRYLGTCDATWRRARCAPT